MEIIRFFLTENGTENEAHLFSHFNWDGIT